MEQAISMLIKIYSLCAFNGKLEASILLKSDWRMLYTGNINGNIGRIYGSRQNYEQRDCESTYIKVYNVHQKKGFLFQRYNKVAG